jgi:branched-chain amino acid transport system permease protein
MLIATASDYIQYLLDSVAYGSLFSLMALGLALLFGVMGLMNFAYGELIMAGAYTMFFTQSWGWLAMIAMTLLVVVVLSLLMDLVAFRPVRRAHANAVTLLITSFAVSYALQELAWTDALGISPTSIGTGVQKGVTPYPWLTDQHDVKGVLISNLEVLTWIVALAMLFGMSLLLKRTTLGIYLRASSEDFRMAQLCGVRANYVISSAFGITGVLAAAVAILFTFRTGAVAPDIGQGPLLIAFVGGVIGGLGSLAGAALGGFVLGVTINLLGATLPISVKSHTQLFAFLVVIAILVFVPDGLITLRHGGVTGWWKRRREPVTEGAA